jgi:hypothetical protein
MRKHATQTKHNTQTNTTIHLICKCISVYVYIYVYAYVHVYIYICVCICNYIYIYIGCQVATQVDRALTNLLSHVAGGIFAYRVTPMAINPCVCCRTCLLLGPYIYVYIYIYLYVHKHSRCFLSKTSHQHGFHFIYTCLLQLWVPKTFMLLVWSLLVIYVSHVCPCLVCFGHLLVIV